MTGFVDTNVFVRLLASDDLGKAARSLDLFERCERAEVTLMASEAVIAEVVYVLSSKTTYRQTRPQIAVPLRRLISIRGLRLDHKPTVLAALDRFETSNLAFTDCLAVEHTRREGLDALYSYDRGLDRVADVRRQEP